MQQEKVGVQSHVKIIPNSKLLTPQWFVGEHSDLPELVDDAIDVVGVCPLIRADEDPRYIYRSMLPFLPPSSPIHVYYNKLSDIRILRVRSPNKEKNIFHILWHGVLPASAITCTALSDDGHRVALGFHNGVVEVVDTELGTTVSRSAGLRKPPVWLLFINRGHKLIIETSNGDIYIWDNSALQRFASRFDGSTTVAASLSHDGSMIVRAAQHLTKQWYENMYMIHITTDSPTIHSLSTPFHIPSVGSRQSLPLQRSIGFSPDDQYMAAFDTQQAFIWSSISFQLIAHYPFKDPRNWFLNTNRPSTMPPSALPDDIIITPFPKHSGSIGSTSCVLFNLAPRRSADPDGSPRIEMHALSLAAVAVPVLDPRGRVWFRGHEIMIIPHGYRHCVSRAALGPGLEAPTHFSLPTSQDGTRFLLHDKEACPVVVDISWVTSDRTTEGIANR